MIPNIQPGIKIAIQAPSDPTEDDLQFIQQLGVEWVVLWTDASKAGYEYYASRRKLYEQYGLKVYGMGNRDVHNQAAIVLNLADRDTKVAQYKQHLRDLGRAGIPYTTYAHMANGIWSNAPQPTRGGAPARAFDANHPLEGHWIQERYQLPLSHGRQYTESEIWDNFASFIHEVAPVAEEAGVLIGVHPDDPPWHELAGVPRCIFSSFDGYQRALDLAASPNVGVCLCVGCWLEGGPLMGKNVLETIAEFSRQNKLFKVHFRNVDQPLPHFVETFIDDGYMDMAKVMHALRAANYSGVVIADHIPLMGGNARIGTAYSIAYMKALLKWANEDMQHPVLNAPLSN